MKKCALVPILVFMFASKLFGQECQLPRSPASSDQSALETQGEDGHIQVVIGGAYAGYDTRPQEMIHYDKLYIYNYCDGPADSYYEFNLNAVLPKFENCGSDCLNHYMYFIANKPTMSVRDQTGTGASGFNILQPCSSDTSTSSTSSPSGWVCLSEKYLQKKHRGETLVIKRCPAVSSPYYPVKYECESAKTVDPSFSMQVKLNYAGRRYGLPKKQKAIVNLPPDSLSSALHIHLPITQNAAQNFRAGVIPNSHLARASNNCTISLSGGVYSTDGTGITPFCRSNFFASHNFMKNSYEATQSITPDVTSSYIDLEISKPEQIYNLRGPIALPLSTVMSSWARSDSSWGQFMSPDPFADVRQVEFYANFISAQFERLTMVWNAGDILVPIISPLDFTVELQHCGSTSTNWAPSGSCSGGSGDARITVVKRGSGVVLQTNLSASFNDSGTVQGPDWYRVVVTTQPSVAGHALGYGISQNDGSQIVYSPGQSGAPQFQAVQSSFDVAVLPMPATDYSSSSNLPLAGFIKNMSADNLQHLQTRIKGFLGLEGRMRNQVIKNILINALRTEEYSPKAGTEDGTNTLSGISSIHNVFDSQVPPQPAIARGWTARILNKYRAQFTPLPFGHVTDAMLNSAGSNPTAGSGTNLYRATWIKTSQSYSNALTNEVRICSPELNYLVSFTQSSFDTRYDFSTSSSYHSDTSASQGLAFSKEGSGNWNVDVCTTSSGARSVGASGSWKALSADASIEVRQSVGNCDSTGTQSSWGINDNFDEESGSGSSSSSNQSSESATANMIGERRVFQSFEAVLTSDIEILYGTGKDAWFSAFDNLAYASHFEYESQFFPTQDPISPVPFRSWVNTRPMQLMKERLNLVPIVIDEGLNLNGQSNNNQPFHSATILLVPDLTSNNQSSNVFSFDTSASNIGPSESPAFSSVPIHSELSSGYRLFLSKAGNLPQMLGGPLFAVNDWRVNYSRLPSTLKWPDGSSVGPTTGFSTCVVQNNLVRELLRTDPSYETRAQDCCLGGGDGTRGSGSTACSVSNIPSATVIDQSQQPCIFDNLNKRCLMNTLSHNYTRPPKAPEPWEFVLKPCTTSPCNFGGEGSDLDFPQYLGFKAGRVPLFTVGADGESSSQVFRAVTTKCGLL